MISDFSTRFSEISHSILDKIVSEKLGYYKFCTCMIPKQFIDVCKTQHINSGNVFLKRLEMEDEEFLYQIVTGDETWVQHVNPETKEQ